MDDEFDPKEKDLDEVEGEGDDFDDELLSGGKKKKGGLHDDDPIESLDALAEEEDGPLPEDPYDDVDLW